MSTEDGPPVTEQLVAETIQHFREMNDPAYREALADNVADPVEEETRAFRSPELAQRSLIQVRHLLAEQANRVKRRADESNKSWEYRQAHWRVQLGTERRILETIVAGLRAQQGIESAAPNPRARAMRRLSKEHPVRFLELVREEEAALKAERDRKKQERKDARRAQPRR